MKQNAKKGLSLLLVLFMFLLPMAGLAQGDLAAQRIEQAMEAGKQLQLSFFVQIGELVTTQMQLPPEMLTGITQALDTAEVRLAVAQDAQGMPVITVAALLKDTSMVDATLRFGEAGILIDTSLLTGKTLMMPYEAVMSLVEGFAAELPPQVSSLMAGEDIDVFAGVGDMADTDAIFSSLGAYGQIVTTWVDANREDMIFYEEQPFAATATRNAAVSRGTIRMQPEQLRALTLALVEQFAQDTALQNAMFSVMDQSGLTTQITPDQIRDDIGGEIAALQAADGALVIEVYMDESDMPVGIDIALTPMFVELPLTTTFAYDYSGDDTYGGIALRAFGPSEEGNQYAVDMRFQGDQRNPQAPQGAMSIRVANEGPSGNSAMVLLGDFDATYADTREALTASLEFLMEENAPSTDGKASNATPISSAQQLFRLDVNSVTEALAGDDFTCDTTVKLDAMGSNVGTLRILLASADFLPTDTSGNTVVDLSTLDEAGMETLNQDMQSGLMRVLFMLISALPPELSQQLMSGGM